jgi:hypothetical protein
MNSIVGHRVLFSKLRGIILGDGDVPDINHRKLDAFKTHLEVSGKNKIELSLDQRNLLFIF